MRSNLSKIKCRIVGRGDDIRDWWGGKAQSGELYTLPIGVAPLRALLSVSVLDEDSEGLQFDFMGAYFQTPRAKKGKGSKMFAILPDELCSEKMSQIRRAGFDPVVPLHKYIYGEPDAGDRWNLHMTGKFESKGWTAEKTVVSGSFFSRGSSKCGVYVDDGAAVGETGIILQQVWELQDLLEMSSIERLRHLLGVWYSKVLITGYRAMLFHQDHYAVLLVERFEAERGTWLPACVVPFISVDQKFEVMFPGKYAGTCRKHLGGLTYLVRCSMPDMIQMVNALCREVQRWSEASDHRLTRIFSYLNGTMTH